MEKYKQDFIDFALSTGALKVGGDYFLKSQRIAPYFINIGDFNDGVSISKIGEAYAHMLESSGIGFDVLYGIPEKGLSLAISTSVGLAQLNVNRPWFFTRKIPKEYGEATNLPKEEKRKSMIVGRIPKTEDRIGILDDVFTTGEAKYDALALLKELLDNPIVSVLGIAVDRQEIGADGKSAIEEFNQKTNIPVISIVNTYEIYQHLKSKPDIQKSNLERMATYLRVYGTESVRKEFEFPEQVVIERDKSVIPACDVSTLQELEDIVKQTADNEKVGAYKIGFELGLGYGLPEVVKIIRSYTQKPIIYDHQKAATDILQTGKNFARVCKKAGVDAVIFFPQAGPETERAWIYQALDVGLKVIVGGRMTHPAYAQSEGGFITDEGALEMYRIAARAKINNFVVPGNKPEVIKTIKEVVEAEGVDPIFYAPGFIRQNGTIEEAAKVAGKRWHVIAGTAIIQAVDKKKAAAELASQI